MQRLIVLLVLLELLIFEIPASANDEEYSDLFPPLVADLSVVLRKDRLTCLGWAYYSTNFRPTETTLLKIRGVNGFANDGLVRKVYELEPDDPKSPGLHVNLRRTFNKSEADYLNAYWLCMLSRGYAMGPISK